MPETLSDWLLAVVLGVGLFTLVVLAVLAGQLVGEMI